ncbi:MAG: formate dehydrogenase accessory protein FdhE [Spirochaetes bacterium]|nr:formate dehydrogenase accessory protein FdhE [Spirochaetota bacterium]
MKNHNTNLELNKEKILQQGMLTEANINFYADIFDYQFTTANRWAAELPKVEIRDEGTEPVLDTASLQNVLPSNQLYLSSLTELAAIISKHNPGLNFDHALELLKHDSANAGIIESLLIMDNSKIEQLAASAGIGHEEFLFLVVNCLKPLFIALREKHYTADPETHREKTCPFCGYYPDMALFSGEKEGKRYLSCGLCENLWAYRRISCAICGESDQKKLEYFSEEGNDRYRVDACHTCNGYIKSVRLNRLDEIENCDLIIENLMTLPLDVEMLKKGFSKP